MPHGGAGGITHCLLGWFTWWARFLLFGYAALELSVGLMAVLNATSPMWGALLSALVLRERLSPGRIAGLLLGIVGVAVLSGAEGSQRWPEILAGLAAAFCYGLTGIVLRRWGRDTSARGMAAGTLL